ncbi:MAG TPA: metalloregulator ArsR/SmtB family transcription factor [Armatimonadota bacterium]|nr:metalloregulator ArsR/SmtB family transcription factor [Armatimonadota bacterium]
MSPVEQDVCEIFCYDEAKVSRLRKDVGQADGLGTLFKALSDETRAKIMFCLIHDELCVCDVANIMGMSVQAVSHHLRLLRTMRLVKYRREGKMAFYSLDDNHVTQVIQQGLAHLREEQG